MREVKNRKSGDFMFNILVVEDDANLRKLMSLTLKQHGYVPFPAVDGVEALKVADENKIDLMISDIMMPNMDGYELTRRIRQQNKSMPVIMVTAKETFEDKAKGFEVGTDDYMVKPINIDEMVLRVGALLRRSNLVSEHILKVGTLELDYEAQSVKVGDAAAQTIPQKEFLLLYKFLSHPNKIFTRKQLMDEIWGMDNNAEERTVDVHIKRIRERYGSCREFNIITVRGLGYKCERISQ